MAIIRLSRGGLINTSGCFYNDTPCPDMYQIAAEHMRGPFNLPGVFYPIPDPMMMSEETAQAELVEKAAVGDTIELLVVPPKKVIHHVAVEVDMPLGSVEMTQLLSNPAPITTFPNAVGLTFDVVGNIYDDPTDPCKIASTVTIKGGISGSEKSWVAEPYDYTTDMKTWMAMGMKITALPTAPHSLGTILNYISIIASGWHFDTPYQQ